MTRPVDLIVIGGSAGGLDALLAILAGFPDEVSIPIAVVIHLPASRPSMLPEILARACRRSVVEAEDKVPIRDGTIYLAPPDYHVLVERDRSLSLSIDAPVLHSRPSIDVLFESAAEAYGAALAGVVLSGASEDGAQGLRRIHEAGGLAIVQEPATASTPAMPLAAIRACGPAAHVVPLAQLGSFLARQVNATNQPGGSPG